MQEPTITAIASALGESSVALIRVSGPEAILIVDKIFRGARSLVEVPSHTVHYGHIISSDGQAIDEVLVTVMHGPKTYTTENVVEIGTHGGYDAAQSVLTEILRSGARLAMPGEFTKRAFLGGRIDLAQAEGVMELIHAQTSVARKAALLQVKGSLTRAIRDIRHTMLEILAHVEVTIDYPEHDVEDATTELVRERVLAVRSELTSLLQTAENGRILKDGIRVAIIGRPNVGKSTLLNQLSRVDRAIVTDIPGTTRDILQEHIQIKGVPLYILDTAGIRETTDVVEEIGVARSKQAMEDADLLLVVIDSGRALNDTDKELLAVASRRRSLVILNKVDLPSVVSREDVARFVPLDDIVPYSVYKISYHSELEDQILQKSSVGKITVADASFIANSRHISLMEDAVHLLDDVLGSIAMGQTLDLVAVDLKQAWVVLGEVIGETPKDDLLDQIFSQFCLGK